MGVMAITTSGAPIYNPLSALNGSLASYYEWTTLDPCYGHTDADYPIYGYASNSAGTTLKSCWYSTSTSPSYMSEFTYNSTGYTAGTCHLDYANGYTFTSGYGYVMVSTNFYAPYYYAGSSKGYVCGFTPYKWI
jgi:hypothetical protein